MIIFKNSSLSVLLKSFFFIVLTYISFAINFYLGFLVILVIPTFLLYYRKYQIAFVFIILNAFLQNGFIAYIGNYISLQDFNLIRGIHFFLPVFVTSIMICSKVHFTRRDINLLIPALLMSIILVLYTIWGISNYGLTPAAAYLRLFSIPFVYFLTGYVFSKYFQDDQFKQVVKFIFWITFVFGFGQFLFPQFFTILMNDVAYYGHKTGDSSVWEVVNYVTSRPAFNLGAFTNYRITGASASFIKHFISFGFFINILAIYLYFNQNKGVVIFVFLSSLFMVSSKGTVLFMFLFLLIYFLRRLRFTIWLSILLVGLIVYLIALLGLRSQNEHLIGFFAGLNYINGIGNGLGFSGNFSTVLWQSYKGDSLPNFGYYTRFQNGSESVYGVLFSSLGLFSYVYIATILYYLYATFLKFKNSRMNILFYLLLIVAFIGIFQEEAYSHFIIGLGSLLVGFHYLKDSKGNLAH